MKLYPTNLPAFQIQLCLFNFCDILFQNDFQLLQNLFLSLTGSDKKLLRGRHAFPVVFGLLPQDVRLLSQFLYIDVNVSHAISYGEEVDHLERKQDEDCQKDCED